MGKNKLMRFDEMATFSHVIQPTLDEVFRKDHALKSKWHEQVFNNNHPIVLELGCGKGEYTVGMARKYPEKNFIGIDIKGARMWRGAKQALAEELKNVAFLRTRIEFINSFFASGEISEIWITFPDPQLKKRRIKKRLTAPVFLNAYKRFLQPRGLMHLKTDSAELYAYTQEVIAINQLENVFHTPDLYHSDLVDDILSIQTFYERMFLEEGKPITYTQFRLNGENELADPPDEEE